MLSDAPRETRGGSFRDAAEDYERGRPGYPFDAVRWLMDGAARVLDLGAGTGKLTSSLVELASEVVALEFELSMIEELRRRVTAAHAVCARAEALPIRSDCVDCVVVAQAFHWFDNDPAVSEMARVLTAGGRLGLVWNVRDRSVDWVDQLISITGEDNSERTLSSLTSRPHFDAFEVRTFRTVQVVDCETLVAHVRSRSHVAMLGEKEQLRLARAVKELCDGHPALAGKRSFEFPYETRAFRARKAEA